MRRSAFVLAVIPLAALAVASPVNAQTQIARTVHNLTSTGPGTMRTRQAAGLCVFCHTPHNANPTRGLWNRDLPGVTYKLYESSTLQAEVKQPTGATRLCLSCHDGTLALGMVRRAPRGARYTIGPLTGKSVLGTDLSDDHPVSFVYDSTLAARRGQLVDPHALPRKVPLDGNHEVQCTSCHDAHEDRNPKFLRLDNRFGALCTICHRLRNWSTSSHAVSTATWNGTGSNPWVGGPGVNVAENACYSCHRPHAAAHPERLLARSDEAGVCTICHNGSVASKNVEQEFSKPFRHPVERSQWAHDPKEEPAVMPQHVTCVDCHSPHQAASAPAAVPGIVTTSGHLKGVRGVTASGGRIDESSFEYEVCLKCHGTREPTSPNIVRQDLIRNIRLKINTVNASYHPIVAAGRNPTIRGLLPSYTATSLITCTDCHNNDEWTQAGTRPRGAHGSIYEAILEREFLATDPVTESFAAYALCYKCHDRSTLLSSTLGRFPHQRHVVQDSASCAACHDSHGSRQNAHLINFMARAKSGATVVTASATGRLDYVANPAGGGSCFLTCHGRNHDPLTY